MAETRILILSNRDVRPASDEVPLVAKRNEFDDTPIDDDSIASVADLMMRTIASAPGVRVTHRSIFRTSELVAAIGEVRPDIIFNLCESLGGDSRLEVAAAWMLDRLEIPFTGNPYRALRYCLHKVEATHLLQRAGVRVPATVRVDNPDRLPKVRFPVIVKPEREDGSRGITKKSLVYNRKRLREQVAEVIGDCKQPAVVQQYIKGRELNVALLGWPVPRVLPIGEITFNSLPRGYPHILTYASKWQTDTTDWRGTPSVAAVLRPRELRRVAAIGRRAFEVLGLRDYGRVDVRLDERGDPYVIDVNPNCDLSPDGGFARAAKRAGMSYQQLIWEVLRCAIRRRSDHAVLFGARGRSPRFPMTFIDAAASQPLERAS